MLGMALNLIGALVMLVFGVKILIAAFRTSTGWGLACLFIPFVMLFYVIKNWAAQKGNFMGWLGGFVLLILGSALGIFGAMGSAGQ